MSHTPESDPNLAHDSDVLVDIRERLEKLAEHHPSAVLLMRAVVEQMERIDLDDEILERALVTIKFCREYPDFALVLASMGGTFGDRSSDPNDN